MLISWNWLKEMVDLSGVQTPARLAELLTKRGIEVESIQDQGKGFEAVVVAEILEKKQHPDADRLSVCQVSYGGPVPIEIVCGATNMKAGDRVALAQVGANLPNGMTIKKGKIRGVESNGMLCSESELGLADESEGILILDKATPIGKNVGEVLARNDTVLELGLTPNRGDCLSHVGVAREVAAAMNAKVTRASASLLSLKGSKTALTLDAGEAGPQFLGCEIENVKIGPSPEWLSQRLKALGQRSINNVVDATNLVMLETGQPMHAYDASRLKGASLSIRLAKKGERLPLLDGTEIELAGSELVIADSEKAVALAGVMGGGNSEVQDSTTKLFLECAEFSPVLVRQAARRHLKHTDAAHRFERGIDPEGLHYAISRLAELIVQVAGGKILGSVSTQHAIRSPRKERQIPVQVSFFSSFLGFKIEEKKCEEILTGLQCKIEKSKDQWTVTPPSYRWDLSIREDLVEEVARSVGYDLIPSTTPVLTNAPTSIHESKEKDALFQLGLAKDVLVQLGFNESLNYSFTSRAWLKELGFESSIPVKNPLSEEQEVMVPSLLPGLLANIRYNWRHHFGSEQPAFRLFEIRPTFHLQSNSPGIAAHSESDTGTMEVWKLSFALTGPRFQQALKNENRETDFSDVKAYVETLFEKLGTRGIRLKAIDASTPQSHLYHPGQSIEVFVGKDRIGCFGRLHPKFEKEWKLRSKVWMAELEWSPLSKLSRHVGQSSTYRPWSEFPSIERDFALLVKKGLEAEKITQVAMKAGQPLAKVVKIFDIYEGSQVLEGMTSVAVRVIFLDERRSLEESEADRASEKILTQWKQELGVELRS